MSLIIVLIINSTLTSVSEGAAVLSAYRCEKLVPFIHGSCQSARDLGHPGVPQGGVHTSHVGSGLLLLPVDRTDDGNYREHFSTHTTRLYSTFTCTTGTV